MSLDLGTGVASVTEARFRYARRAGGETRADHDRPKPNKSNGVDLERHRTSGAAGGCLLEEPDAGAAERVT
jgi:hypothetical protein